MGREAFPSRPCPAASWDLPEHPKNQTLLSPGRLGNALVFLGGLSPPENPPPRIKPAGRAADPAGTRCLCVRQQLPSSAALNSSHLRAQ